jgi:3D (Asp-Asp-Asp) domain-containing protein
VIPHHVRHVHAKPKPWPSASVIITAYVTNPMQRGLCDVYTKLTRTETHPQVGTAAVDPHVFPFGTRFKVPGYGYAVARDTGSAIVGYRIDLVVETCQAAWAWGRQSVIVKFHNR